MAQEYVKLTEHNEWEGETWHFYIPIAGNEDAIDMLQVALEGIDRDQFQLVAAPISENDVDLLVKHGGDTDYMAAHNKLEGRLVLTEEILAPLGTGDLDPLYKGRITDHMKAAT